MHSLASVGSTVDFEELMKSPLPSKRQWGPRKLDRKRSRRQRRQEGGHADDDGFGSDDGVGFGSGSGSDDDSGSESETSSEDSELDLDAPLDVVAAKAGVGKPLAVISREISRRSSMTEVPLSPRTRKNALLSSNSSSMSMMSMTGSAAGVGGGGVDAESVRSILNRLNVADDIADDVEVLADDEGNGDGKSVLMTSTASYAVC